MIKILVRADPLDGVFVGRSSQDYREQVAAPEAVTGFEMHGRAVGDSLSRRVFADLFIHTTKLDSRGDVKEVVEMKVRWTTDKEIVILDAMVRDDDDLIEQARGIATAAHHAQVDKTGHPYITHPARVADRVRRLFPEAPAGARAAALLHDVIEDTELTADDLLEAGMPSDVVDAVVSVTKRAGEVAEAYFARVRANAWGVMVKTADIEDNTDPGRVAQLDPPTRARLASKYARSRILLVGE